MTELETFRLRWPQFDTVPDDQVTLQLADAAQEIGACAWGRLYARAVMALAAHQLEIAAGASAAAGMGTPGMSVTGALQSLRTGDLSVSFGSRTSSSKPGGSSDDIYGQTAGGQEYLRLRARLFKAPRLTGGGGDGCGC